MALSRLSGRLARIRETRKGFSPSGKSILQEVPEESAVFLSGGWKPAGKDLFERITDIPFPCFRQEFSPYLPLLFPREKEAPEWNNRAAGLAKDLVFFDLETTGLSHGAGTVAFMAGVARFVSVPPELPGTEAPAVLRIHQLLLADYPGEPEFLLRFGELAGSRPVFVSFNGKCFDSQILNTRFLMNGMRPSFILDPPLHLDLLFPSRRLWKAELGSCRLSVLEERILLTPRTDDLPGSEAPEAWFDFLREGDSGRLLRIGDHNREDCVSLARLLFTLDDSIHSATGRASLVRALDLRSRKDYAGAARFLEPLAEAGDRTALTLIAVDAEHRTGELDRALEAACLLDDEKRQIRLRSKIEKRKL